MTSMVLIINDGMVFKYRKKGFWLVYKWSVYIFIIFMITPLPLLFTNFAVLSIYSCVGPVSPER